MGFGEGFERVEFLQFLGSHLLEGGRNRPLLDIDLFAGDVFELLDGLRQRLQADRLPGREQRVPESRVVRERRPGQRVLVVVEPVALVRDLDLPSPEQDGEHQPQHVPLPAVADPAESPLQRLAHAGLFVAVALLALEVVEHLLDHVGRRD